MRNRTHVLAIAGSVVAMVIGGHLSSTVAAAVAKLSAAYFWLPPAALFALALGGIVWSAVSVLWTDVPCPITVDVLLVVVIADGLYRLLAGTRLWFEFYGVQYLLLSVAATVLCAVAIFKIMGWLIAAFDPPPSPEVLALLTPEDPYDDPHAAQILDNPHGDEAAVYRRLREEYDWEDEEFERILGAYEEIHEEYEDTEAALEDGFARCDGFGDE